MILIIAEKPSLARNIAAGIGSMQKRQGYLEGQGYLITWAFGHLFSLCDIETYQPQADGSQKWTLSNLPCFPTSFQFELRRGTDKQVDDGVRRQFETIAALCNRTCLCHLEEKDALGNKFENAFRQREAWVVDAKGHIASRDTESANVLGGQFSKDGDRGNRK